MNPMIFGVVAAVFFLVTRSGDIKDPGSLLIILGGALALGLGTTSLQRNISGSPPPAKNAGVGDAWVRRGMCPRCKFWSYLAEDEPPEHCGVALIHLEDRPNDVPVSAPAPSDKH